MAAVPELVALVVEAQEALVAAVLAVKQAAQAARLVQQIQVLVAVVVQHLVLLEAQAVRALSLFVMRILMLPLHQPQGRPQLLCLAVIVYTNGQVQGVSHSDGTLCTT